MKTRKLLVCFALLFGALCLAPCSTRSSIDPASGFTPNLGLAKQPAASPSTVSPFSGSVAWDFAVNKPVAIATYSDGWALNFPSAANPVVRFGPDTLGGVYLAGLGTGLGQGLQLSVYFQGKLLGYSLKGSSLTISYDEVIFTSEKAHPVLYVMGAVSSNLLSAFVK